MTPNMPMQPNASRHRKIAAILGLPDAARLRQLMGRAFGGAPYLYATMPNASGFWTVRVNPASRKRRVTPLIRLAPALLFGLPR